LVTVSLLCWMYHKFGKKVCHRQMLEVGGETIHLLTVVMLASAWEKFGIERLQFIE